MRRTIVGKYKLKNPKKYKGNPNDIVYRSSYELKMMNFLDVNSHILEWSSESVVISYISPVDNRRRNYYTDFFVKLYDENTKSVKGLILEVKPKKFLTPPKYRKTNSYIKEVKEYLKNKAKWDAARKYCEGRNVEFKIITEDNLNI